MTRGSDFWVRRRPAAAPDERALATARRTALLRRLAVPDLPVSIGQTAHRDALYQAFQDVRRDGGPAAGPDGVAPDRLSGPDAGYIVAELSARLRDGTYRPGPARAVSVPKGPGRPGARRLAVGGVADRVVARALLTALTPVWEARFRPSSYGFRPGTGAWHLLADLVRTVEADGRWVLAVDDVRAAFDAVKLADAYEAHDRAFAAAGTTVPAAAAGRWAEAVVWYRWLVGAVLGGGRPGTARGLVQGNNYAPAALNLVLHDALDDPLAASIGHPPWFRYADNVCVPVRGASEGRAVLADVARRLRPLGLALKGADGVADLAARPAEVLGFRLARTGDRVELRPGAAAEARLAELLRSAHSADSPSSAARQAVAGWLYAAGPALASVEACVDGYLRLAAGQGFRELGSRESLLAEARRGYADWQRIRQSRATGPAGPSAGPPSQPTPPAWLPSGPTVGPPPGGDSPPPPGLFPDPGRPC